MKKFDSLTVIGLVVGIFILIFGMYNSVGFKIFLDFPSMLIAIGGSLCALIVNYSLEEIKNIGKVFFKATKDTEVLGSEIVIQFADISKKARIDGLLSLDDYINTMEDEFFKNGLRMVVDGTEPEMIKEIMELEIDEMINRHTKGANIFKSWGNYAQAFGMIGTLIGLIQMLNNLNDSGSLASSMAKALVATLYGVILANAILNPIAANLGVKSAKEVAMREMIVEGVLSIQAGVNPRMIEEKLVKYLSPKERLEYLKNTSSLKGAVYNG